MNKKIRVGTLAQDFTLAGTSGEQITLSDYRGKKIVVLVFNRGFM